jgi:hypothetical protein
MQESYAPTSHSGSAVAMAAEPNTVPLSAMTAAKRVAGARGVMSALSFDEAGSVAGPRGSDERCNVSCWVVCSKIRLVRGSLRCFHGCH